MKEHINFMIDNEMHELPLTEVEMDAEERIVYCYYQAEIGGRRYNVELSYQFKVEKE